MPIFYTDTGSFNRLEVSGSTVLSGSTSIGSGEITGSLFGTASVATSASYALTSSFALNLPANIVSNSNQVNTGSFTGSFFGILSGSVFGTSSWATSASYVLPSGLPAGTVSASSQINGSQIGTNTITIGNTSTALGGTSTTITGLTSITSTSITGSITGSLTGPHTGSTFGTASWATSASYVLPSGLPAGTVSSSTQINGTQIQNNTITIGNTSTALGGTSTTITGLTSITSTSITGSVTGSITGSLLGTSSFATTASFALNAGGSVFPFSGSAVITGSLLVSSSTNTLFVTGASGNTAATSAVRISGSVSVEAGTLLATGKGPTDNAALIVNVPNVTSNDGAKAIYGAFIDNTSMRVAGELVVQERYYSPAALITTPGKITLTSGLGASGGVARIIFTSLLGTNIGHITTKVSPSVSTDDFLSIRTLNATPLIFGANSTDFWSIATNGTLAPFVNNSYNLGSTTNTIASIVTNLITSSIVSASAGITGSSAHLNSLTVIGAVTASAISASAFVTFPQGLLVTGSVTASIISASLGITGSLAQFNPVSLKITVGTTAPSSPAVNDLWVDTN